MRAFDDLCTNSLIRLVPGSATAVDWSAYEQKYLDFIEGQRLAEEAATASKEVASTFGKDTIVFGGDV